MGFTCICCDEVFEDGEIQRLHYKSSWHKYNLQRKVVNLPSISLKEFQRRAIILESNQQDTSKYCKYCCKAFSNFKTYENHLSSKKHKLEASYYVEPVQDESSIADDDDITEKVDSDEFDESIEVDVRDCLFCLHHSKTLTKNVKHMSENHSFFIPDIEFCSNISGLINYLALKIEQYYVCLWCNDKGKAFHSAEAARQHMLDKGHTKMIYEDVVVAEYQNFYKYTTTHPNGDVEYIGPNQVVKIPKMEGNEYQLVLPSGSVIGHRSLIRYYKQNLYSIMNALKRTAEKYYYASHLGLRWAPED